MIDGDDFFLTLLFVAPLMGLASLVLPSGKRVTAAAQLLGVAALMGLFRLGWPTRLWSRPHLIEPWMALLLWAPPFAIYAGRTIARKHGPCRRWLWVAGAFLINVASIVLLGTIGKILEEREHRAFWESVEKCRAMRPPQPCPAGYPIMDPPPPPLHWEWGFAAFVILLVAGYAALYWLQRDRPQAASARS